MDQIKIIEDPEFIRCMLDETRRKMVLEMIREPKTISQIAKKLGKTPATIHYHIKRLSKVGVVKLVKTKIVNNNLVEKYYQTTLPSPYILGIGLSYGPHKGPVPPKKYGETKAYMALDEKDIESIMNNLNLSYIPELKEEFVESLNDIISAISLHSLENFRNVCQQLDVKIPANSLQKLEAISAVLPVLTLFRILKKPEYVAVLQRMIQSIRKL